MDFTAIRHTENAHLKDNGVKLPTRVTFTGTLMKPAIKSMIEKENNPQIRSADEEDAYPYAFTDNPHPLDGFFLARALP